MGDPDSCIREIKSIDEELKRLSIKSKMLRNQKKEKQKILYQYMLKHKLQEYKGVKITKVKPLPKRKTEKQKKAESIEMFRKAGIPNPEKFYLEYKNKMKNKTDEEKAQFITNRAKNDYNPSLGF